MNKSMKSSSIRSILKKLGISEENIKIIDPIIEFKEENRQFDKQALRTDFQLVKNKCEEN